MFRFQMNASYLINEYLQNNNICIIFGKKGVGKKYLIENMEFEYDRFPIVENAYTVKDFYSQLLVFKTENNTVDLEIGIGNPIQTTIPISQILNKFRNFIKSDFDNLENKVTNELDILAKKNNLLLPIQLYKNTSNNLLNLIFNRLTNLDIKILIIVNEEDLIYLKQKIDFDSIPNVILDYQIEDIYFEFEDLLSKNDIEKANDGKVHNECLGKYIEVNRSKLSLKDENDKSYKFLYGVLENIKSKSSSEIINLFIDKGLLNAKGKLYRYDVKSNNITYQYNKKVISIIQSLQVEAINELIKIDINYLLAYICPLYNDSMDRAAKDKLIIDCNSRCLNLFRLYYSDDKIYTEYYRIINTQKQVELVNYKYKVNKNKNGNQRLEMLNCN